VSHAGPTGIIPDSSVGNVYVWDTVFVGNARIARSPTPSANWISFAVGFTENALLEVKSLTLRSALGVDDPIWSNVPVPWAVFTIKLLLAVKAISVPLDDSVLFASPTVFSCNVLVFNTIWSVPLTFIFVPPVSLPTAKVVAKSSVDDGIDCQVATPLPSEVNTSPAYSNVSKVKP